MPLRRLWNAIRSPEKGSAISSGPPSPRETIRQSLHEQREIIDQLKRYEDMTYRFVARRFDFLQQELAGLFEPPSDEHVLIDRRVHERRTVKRPVSIERRKGTDRRASHRAG